MARNRRAIGRQSVKAGKQGEDVATMQLRLLGLEMVDVIHTGWQVVRWINRAEDIAVVVPAKKVRGDRAAIVPGTGQRVLAEVKSFDEDRLVWSRWVTVQYQDGSTGVHEGYFWRGSVHLRDVQENVTRVVAWKKWAFPQPAPIRTAANAKEIP